MAEQNIVRRERHDATVREAMSVEPGQYSSHVGRGTSPTVSWKAIEPWQRDNEYILTGYRRVQRSFRGCLASLFGYLHNETVNIHSHLSGAVLFAYLLCTSHSTHATTTWHDDAVFAIFLSSTIFCLLGSATMHAFSCHSEPVCARCHALDYTGIVVLIVGSFFPCIYYGFYCDPHIQVFYLSLISISGMGE